MTIQTDLNHLIYYLLLDEGDKCVPRFHGGGAFLAKCADKLECGKDGTCIKKVSS